MIKSINIKNIEINQIANLINEIDIYSKLRHPNIVQFIGISLDLDNFYIITEYIE